ncbi:MAG: tellurite resistance TerB family protein [Geminicoccaceae bacterium]
MSFENIIGELLQQGMGGQTQQRLQHTASRSGGGLDEMLGALLGGNSGVGQPAAPAHRASAPTHRTSSAPSAGSGAGGGLGGLAGGLGGLGGLGKLAQDILGGQQAGGMSGAQIGGLGALVGAVLGGGGGALKGAAGGGVMAILGSMALTALKNYQADAAASAEAAPARRMAPPPVTHEEVAEVTDPRTERLVLRAMIDAAKADGKVDRDEMQRIIGQIEPGSVTAEERQYVIDEMSRPSDPGGLAREVSSPAVAAQVYAASILAIHIDTEAERAYLRNLASLLRLDAGTVRRLHEMTGAPAV